MRAALIACTVAFASLAVAPLASASFGVVVGAGAGDSGAAGVERGLVVLCGKALVLPMEGQQVIDNAAVVVEDGKIVSVSPRADVDLEALATTHDVLDRSGDWVSPGLIDLHSHVAGRSFFTNDLNDMVYLTNPGIRAFTSVVPGNSDFVVGRAAGVTSVLYIPGSGTNIGGHGVLLKTGFDTYERMEIRNPGSLKLAQAGNPESYLSGVGRSFMNWNTRNTIERGIAYAKRWEAFSNGDGPRPKVDPMWEVFRDLYSKQTQLSAHTQIYQVVLRTVQMIKEDLGLDVYIDHGSFDGWRAAPFAAKAGVPAILGPRQISASINIEYRPGLFIVNDNDGAIFGMAAKYQEGGCTLIGFNTDAPVIGQEALPLQASMAVRYGFKNDAVEHVRGLTIIPAFAAGIHDRIGSLEPGKDADFIVTSGDPTDPRTQVHLTFQEGERVYDAEVERRF
ncbi:amidohydrolase family protein [Planctomycetota bacterium]|jgi:imidazolonepropionase-like amidohydrolase|nr:amidohydrolase family protein [Planctomycetota bacterium]